MTKVSVITGVCNSEAFLVSAIKSILNQGLKDFEFIIVNDASTDKSSEIINKFAEKDKRIKILKNKKRLGLTKSLNKALKASKGQYIARMDADDIAFPQRIEVQVKFMEKHPEIAILGSWAYLIDEKGKKLSSKKMPVKPRQIRKSAIASNPFIHPTLMIRTEILRKLGGYNNDFTYAQDYELVLRILKNHKGANLPKPLILYRVGDSESISINRLKEQERFALKARIKAVRELGYSGFNDYFNLVKPTLSYLVPAKLKLFIYQRFFWKS